MKKSFRDAYVQAVVAKVEKLTKGKARPVAVDAYRLFDSACVDAGLAHPYGRGDSRHIILSFAEEVFRRCYAKGIVTMKIPGRILEKVPHGKECDIDEQRDPNWYAQQGMLTRGNEAVALVLFGASVSEVHPILYGDLERSERRTLNTRGNHRMHLDQLQETGHITKETIKSLENGDDVLGICSQ